MISVSIKTDFAELQRKLKALSQNVQSRVVPAAINKVAGKANTEMVQAITSEFAIKSGDVRGKLRLKRATRDAAGWFSVLQPVATSRRDGALNLIRFVKGRKKTKAQLKFQIKKTGGRVTVNGAFVATNSRTGGTAVFQRVAGRYIQSRVNKSGHSKHTEALKAVSTIGVPQMFNTLRINSRVVDRIRRELPIEFERAIKAALAGGLR